jgi:hypothetical protein
MFFVQVRSSDDVARTAMKRAMIGFLVHAQTGGREVEIAHADGSAEATNVATTTCDVTRNPLQMDAIEVVQAIQDLSQSVPLVAGKKTVVRVYLSYYSSSPLRVRGEISVRRGPSDPPLAIPSLNTILVDPAQAGNVAIKRADTARSLNFLLPDSHTAVGQLAIGSVRIIDVSTGNPVSLGCERRPIVSFQATPPLRVRVLGMRYRLRIPGATFTFTPSSLDFQLLLSWLRRAYPVAEVVSSLAIVDATPTPPFVCDDINAQLAAIRALDMSAGGDRRTHYYGLVGDGGFFMRGCSSGIPSTPDPTYVASGPTGSGTYGWDFDGSYGDWYGGHELGHTFGRKHPGFCSESKDDLMGYPYANGQLASTDASFVGLDVGDSGLNLPMVALPGTQWHDVMTYCDFQWLSAYTYQAIRLRLLDEDGVGSSGAGGGGNGAPGGGSGGGRPDERFPQTAPAEQREAGETAGETLVSVVATVNLTRRNGKLKFVHPVSDLPTSGTEKESPIILRLKRADGKFLRDYPVAVRLNSELSTDDERVGLVDTTIPVDPEARMIELVVEENVADTFHAGGVPPVVRGIRTMARDRAEAIIAFELDRPLDENQTYSAQVSTDRGKTWQTVAVGLKEPRFAFDRNDVPEGQEVRVRVMTTNGFVSSIVTSDLRL